MKPNLLKISRRLLFAAAVLLGGPSGAHAATYVVSTLSDSGTGSLRYGIANANPGDTVDATEVSGTITLSGSSLTVGENLTINGPGPALLAVSGDNASLRLVREIAAVQKLTESEALKVIEAQLMKNQKRTVKAEAEAAEGEEPDVDVGP